MTYALLKKGLEIRGFKESVADPCVFIKQNGDGFKAVMEATSTLISDGIDPRGGSSISNDDAANTQIYRDAVSSSNTLKADSASDIAGGTVIKSNTSNSDNFWIKEFLHKSSDILVLVYVDKCIIISRYQKSIDMFINMLKYGPEIFAFTDKGLLHQYLGVEIERLSDDTVFTMTQPFLIKRILEAAKIDLRMTNSSTNPVVGPLLSGDEDGPDRKHE